MVLQLSNVDIKVIEIGGSFAILTVFIVLFALVKEIAGAWSNILYVVVFLGFIAAICVFGLKLSPYLSG